MDKWYLQIEPGTWVLWGYGPGQQVVHVSRVTLELGYGVKIPFTLPEVCGGNLPAPQEYERRKGYGWRFNTTDESQGHSWNFAKTIDEAITAAKESVTAQRFDTQKIFNEALCDVRIGPKATSEGE